MSTDVQDREPTFIELESLKPLRPDIEAITSLSIDSLHRYYAKYIVKLSPRRSGMKLRHALAIASGKLSKD
ncbi:hypothetical protein IVA95_16165 [Bradyrhizobium sp. 157]|uniref:hypothetical protein n=1 Tax=Bradyrhizobium sp. 157 TaxID=2782631 RepID=UPI001FF779B2|nr:hypothetical protein [Bradyrhizobium sp. 157]MCK1639096.1 hypothetical protein [Bradyrhizobium sp. 157]